MNIMFNSTLIDAAQLKSTWLQWRNMNWVRTAVILAGVICSALALHKTYAVSQTDF